MVDIQQGFAEAQRALQAGDLERCSALLGELIEADPNQPAFYHLAGVTLKKQERLEQARAAFERGIALRDDIPAMHAEYASLLDDLGEGEAAVAAYDRAIALAPDLVDARIDRALVRHRHVDSMGGYRDLSALTESYSDNARLWLNVGLTARALGLLDEAEEAVERALALAPEAAKSLRLKAQLALDRGKPAVDLFRAAHRVKPDDKDIWAGEAAALLDESRRDEAEIFLKARLEKTPTWYHGQHMLAQVRWQSGDPEGYVDGYRNALRNHPRDKRLWMDMIVATARGQGHDVALPLYDEARRTAGDDPRFDNLEANSLTELGELEKAGELYEQHASERASFFRMPFVRYLLKTRDFDRAQRLAMELVENGEGAEAWPYISIAWRMMGDPRWGWLEGDRDLAKAIDIEPLRAELPALADRLRHLHRWETHPFEQSLRNGTQTDSILFTRSEPEIVSLVGHIRTAVRSYIDGLPPPEKDHPFLGGRRGDFRFSGSWSVRLTGSGFHVNHIHNQGWLSSALYVALPDTIGEEQSREGWLALGEAPQEFGLDAPPIKMVKPEPGRLALFPSIMWHGTKPFSEGERLTVAFDVVVS
ncbi:putative 2OG-Fe(II) oxygenase [uncultured Parasphingopyxis sp.]|uniref:2OG-Fe(II) oxygenase family protein n=1 Tax=uncultured Parasphingopyxis sp. TaxID=1547918 RepID=UPI002603729B|nr:putative 2OG-Fe(II) oxygenase [uncultured Parasphingopyxis sp.]